jgi:hypothetical protein
MRQSSQNLSCQMASSGGFAVEHIFASSARRANRACFVQRKIIRSEVEYGFSVPENGFSIA